METRILQVRRILDRLTDQNAGNPRHSGRRRFWNRDRDDFIEGPIYGRKTITPGDPDNSFLVEILKGPIKGAFSRMPAGGPYISDQDLEFIVQWIRDGAPDIDEECRNELQKGEERGQERRR